MKVRRCNVCQKYKWWYDFGMNRIAWSGITTKCRDCLKAYDRAHRKKVVRWQDVVYGQYDTTKERHCTKCHKILPLENFYADHISVKGQQCYGSWCSRCRKIFRER